MIPRTSIKRGRIFRTLEKKKQYEVPELCQWFFMFFIYVLPPFLLAVLFNPTTFSLLLYWAGQANYTTYAGFCSSLDEDGRGSAGKVTWDRLGLLNMYIE